MTTSTKSFAITKRQVWQAWKRVRANRGAAGIDQETIAAFEKNLPRNLYTIWNRMASGSYFPPSVKEVGIPKKGGGVRVLGVPTVADRVAQTVAKESLEKMLEPHFDPDSYGYRPLRSAKDAVRVTRQRCWKYDWVLEFDVKGAFDNLDHDLLWKALASARTASGFCCMFDAGSRRPRYPKAVRFIRVIAARRKACRQSRADESPHALRL